MNGLQIVCGSRFEWLGHEGWATEESLGTSFEPQYVGYTDDVGFVVKSHRTGAEKLFKYSMSLLDSDGNFEGTLWESAEGFRISIEHSGYWAGV